MASTFVKRAPKIVHVLWIFLLTYFSRFSAFCYAVSGKLHSSIFTSKGKEPKSDDHPSHLKNSLESPMPDDGFSTSSCAISLCDPDGLHSGESRSESRDSNISTRPSSTLSTNKKSHSWHRRISLNVRSPTESYTEDVSRVNRPTTTPTFANAAGTVITKHYATQVVYKPSSGIPDIVEGKESQFVRSSSSATLPPNFPASSITTEKHKAAWKKLFGWKKKNKSQTVAGVSEGTIEESYKQNSDDLGSDLSIQKPVEKIRSSSKITGNVESKTGSETFYSDTIKREECYKSSDGINSTEGVFFDSEDEIFEPRSPDSMEEFSFKFGQHESPMRRLKAALPQDVICELKNLSPPPTEDFIPVRKQKAASDISGDSQFVDGDTTSDELEIPIQPFSVKPHPAVRSRKVTEGSKTSKTIAGVKPARTRLNKDVQSADKDRKTANENKKPNAGTRPEKITLKESKNQELDDSRKSKDAVKTNKQPIQKSNSVDITLLDNQDKGIEKPATVVRRSSSVEDVLDEKYAGQKIGETPEILSSRMLLSARPKSKKPVLEKPSKLRFPLRTHPSKNQDQMNSIDKSSSYPASRIPTQSTASSRNKENKNIRHNDSGKLPTKTASDRKKSSIGRSGIRSTQFNRRSIGRNSGRKLKQEKRETVLSNQACSPTRNPQNIESDRLDFKHVQDMSQNRPVPTHNRSRSIDSIGSIAGYISMDAEGSKSSEEAKEWDGSQDKLDLSGTMSPSPGSVFSDGETKVIKQKVVNRKQQRSSLVNTPSGISVMDDPQEVPHRLPVLQQTGSDGKTNLDVGKSEPNWTRNCAAMLNYHKYVDCPHDASTVLCVVLVICHFSTGIYMCWENRREVANTRLEGAEDQFSFILLFTIRHTAT